MATQGTPHEEIRTRGSVEHWWLVDFLRPIWVPFVLSRSAIFVLALVLDWLLETGRAFHYAYIGDAPLPSLSATFDANWYSDIATNGYSTSADVTIQQNYQFRPLYPLLMRVVGTLLGLGNVGGGYNLAGVIVSHVCFLFALGVLYMLTARYFADDRAAKYAVWAMAVLPWSFVYSMAYTESLFLLLSVLAVQFALNYAEERRSRFILLASAAVTLATLTRPQGIVLLLPVVFFILLRNWNRRLTERLRDAAVLIVPAVAAFAGYIGYVMITTGSTATPFAVNKTWGAGWWQDQMHIFTLPPANPVWWVDIVSTAGLISWLLLLTVLVRNRVDRRHEPAPPIGSNRIAAWLLTAYSVAYFLSTALTIPTNASWGRYMLVVFPCVWAAGWLAQEARKRVSPGVLISAALSCQVLLFAGAFLLQITP